MKFLSRLDIILQVSTPILRPFLFTYAVNMLPVHDGSSEHLLRFIGIIGLFSIPSAMTQSYARSKALYVQTPPLWLVLMAAICVYSTIFAVELFRTSIGYDIILIFSAYMMQSALLIFEHRSSQKDCILISNAIELTIIFASTYCIAFGYTDNSFLLRAMAFTTFPLGSILGLLIVSSFNGARVTATSSSNREGDSRSSNASRFMAFSILLQVVCAIAASAAAIYNYFAQDQALYVSSLIWLRWIHTFGGAASLIINIFSSRIFFKSMNTGLFSSAAQFAAAHTRALYYVIFFSVFLFILFSYQFTGYLVLIVITQSILFIGIMNFFSSILLSFGRPGLSFLCQICVVELSFLSVSTIYGHIYIGYGLYFLFLGCIVPTLQPISRACRELR